MHIFHGTMIIYKSLGQSGLDNEARGSDNETIGMGLEMTGLFFCIAPVGIASIVLRVPGIHWERNLSTFKLSVIGDWCSKGVFRILLILMGIELVKLSKCSVDGLANEIYFGFRILGWFGDVLPFRLVLDP